ncbi:MAG: hypothetical protein HQL78_03640 [Magnetococcales bacterium]|nr:hypothetical protein [Magnetococcales bacterium]MBF0419238.1 hypothetical protein [Magnetococcales bacterium]
MPLGLVRTVKWLGLVCAMLVFAFPAFPGELPSGRLLFVTREGCPYCRAFKESVGQFYHKTQIGKQFPLTEVDRDAPAAEFMDLVWEVTFFPTFVVYGRDGKEIARFRGYRGDEAFWADMEKVIQVGNTAR